MDLADIIMYIGMCSYSTFESLASNCWRHSKWKQFSQSLLSGFGALYALVFISADAMRIQCNQCWAG